MSDIAERITELSPEKRELLLHKLSQEKKAKKPRPEAIKPLGRESNTFPLSFTQERLWFLDQLNPGTYAYNVPKVLRLTGELNVGAIKESFNEILARHEVLRTNFLLLDGEPVQVIVPPQTAVLRVIDLGELPASEQMDQAQEIVQVEIRRPFDLKAERLIRLGLIRLAAEDHLFILVIHHIVGDGWSIGILLQEFMILYQAFCQGQPSLLPALPIQYVDFALWQRKQQQGERLRAQLDYWRQQLGGDLPVLALPADHPRPAIQTHSGALQTLVLPEALVEALRGLARREGATLFMVLLAAFKTLLYRYTGQDDVIIGTPIAARNRSEIEGLIGPFLNTLVLRTDLSGNPSFLELLERVRQVTSGAYAHQDTPIEHLLEDLQPARDLDSTPFFRVLFNMLNFPQLPAVRYELTVENFPLPAPGSKFDLTLYVYETPGGIRFELVYNRDLFDWATMAQMLERWQTLLEGIAADPARHLSTLPLLPQSEQRRLTDQANLIRPSNEFIEFNRAEIESSIPGRFEAQVEKYPQNIAVKTKNYEWTYDALNQRVNRIVKAIRAVCGPGPQRIALLFDHDAPMIAGLLGVLKAGKTYVPLDASYPQERLAYILQDSQANVVLTNARNLALAAQLGQGGRQLINIDAIEPTAATDEATIAPDTPVSSDTAVSGETAISPDTVAYILYTSGSTGQPKGVVQNHRNVLHFSSVYTNNLHINASDRLTLFSSYSFDAAIMDIFGALLNGATLCPINIKEDGLANPARLLAEAGITIFHSTPTLYRHIVTTLSDSQKLLAIRLVVLGGEEVYRRDVALYKKHFSSACIFVNGLGPTESTVSLQYFINHETRITRNTVPVGYPVADTEILLLDERGDQTGVYGEIAIKSPYVALGYWRKPEITAEQFLSDPAGGKRRTYRTGDIGRLRPDGSIEFVGRQDLQVKIRGFRIELDEIELVLSQHFAIREAVVVAHKVRGMLAEKRLAAYVTLDKEAYLSPNVEVNEQDLAGELRNFVQRKLPEYMVPAAFIFLDALPLTPTGKIARRSLPAPGSVNPESDKTFVAPRDELEFQLLKTWETVLEVKPISVKDNFFDLGGHSLLAIRLVAQIEKVFAKKLPLATLFQASTVEQLADVLRQKAWTLPWSSLVPVQPAGSKPPLFFVHGGGGHVLFFHNLARNLDQDQPLYGLQRRELGGKYPRQTRIEDMAAYYIQEIQILQPEGPYFLGGYCIGGTIAFEMAQQLRRQGHKVSLLALIAAGYPPGIRRPCSHYLYRLLEYIRYRIPIRALLFTIQEKLGKLAKRFRKWLVRRFNPDCAQNDGRKPQSLMKLSYKPQVYPGQITLFETNDRTLAFWSKLTTKAIDGYMIPSTHFTIFQEPYVHVLAERLTGVLKKNIS